MTDWTPTLGGPVHYVSYGTPGGEYDSVCRAAVISGLPKGALPTVDAERAETWDSNAVVADLFVMNPTGLFFNRCPQDELLTAGSHRGGTWHRADHV